MQSADDRLQGVLDGYAGFLRDRNLARPNEQPYMVRWVREFLLFARAHGGYTFEQTLDLFLAEAGARVGVLPWQIQQAADSVRIYRYQYRTPAEREGDGGNARGFQDDHTLLERLQQVIRLRHYRARSHAPKGLRPRAQDWRGAPKGLRPRAQGWPEWPTLGWLAVHPSTPPGLCHEG